MSERNEALFDCPDCYGKPRGQCPNCGQIGPEDGEPLSDSEHEAALALVSSAVDLIRHYRETRDAALLDDRHLAGAWLIRHRDFLETWYG
jgi:hypothetical protein